MSENSWEAVRQVNINLNAEVARQVGIIKALEERNRRLAGALKHVGSLLLKAIEEAGAAGKEG